MTRLQYQKGSNLTNIATADSPTGSGSKSLSVGNMQYNGSSFDAERNNSQGTVLASLARTTGVQAPNFTNYNARGLILAIYVSALSGTNPTLQVQVEFVDPVSGFVANLSSATTGITATGLYFFTVYPTALANLPSSSVGSTQVPLPRTWSLYANVSGTSPSITYSIGYSYIL